MVTKKFGKIGKKVRVDGPPQKKVHNFPIFWPTYHKRLATPAIQYTLYTIQCIRHHLRTTPLITTNLPVPRGFAMPVGLGIPPVFVPGLCNRDGLAVGSCEPPAFLTIVLALDVAKGCFFAGDVFVSIPPAFDIQVMLGQNANRL